MINIQKQTWQRLTLYLLTTEGASVQLEIYPEPEGKFKEQAYICKLWVEPEYRRKGIAKALLNTAEALARRNGMEAVFLDWYEPDTPRWMLDHYIERGYDDVAFADDNALLKKILINPDNKSNKYESKRID